MRRILLYGHLAERFGREFHLAVDTPGEAVRALCAVLAGFRHAVIDGGHYKVFSGGETVTEGALCDPTGGQVFRIVPVVAGAGRSGFVTAIIGAALIGASFFLPTTALFAVGAFAPSLSSIAGSIGVSLLLGGAAQILTPTPSAPDPANSPENQPSFAFDGAVNTAAKGSAIALCFGRHLAGSTVLSSGLSVERL